MVRSRGVKSEELGATDKSSLFPSAVDRIHASNDTRIFLGKHFSITKEMKNEENMGAIQELFPSYGDLRPANGEGVGRKTMDAIHGDKDANRTTAEFSDCKRDTREVRYGQEDVRSQSASEVSDDEEYSSWPEEDLICYHNDGVPHVSPIPLSSHRDGSINKGTYHWKKNFISKTVMRVFPLHLPPDDISSERTVYIDKQEKIQIAKQLVNEVISSEDESAPSYGGPGGASQSSPGQQTSTPAAGSHLSYASQSPASVASSYPAQGSAPPSGYGAPPLSGYGTHPAQQGGYGQSAYGQPSPQGQKPPASSPYGQAPPSSAQGGYGQYGYSSQPGYGAPHHTLVHPWRVIRAMDSSSLMAMIMAVGAMGSLLHTLLK